MRIVDYFGQLHSEEICIHSAVKCKQTNEALTQPIGSRAASAGYNGTAVCSDTVVVLANLWLFPWSAFKDGFQLLTS